jgi:hypothetical protein
MGETARAPTLPGQFFAMKADFLDLDTVHAKEQ